MRCSEAHTHADERLASVEPWGVEPPDVIELQPRRVEPSFEGLIQDPWALKDVTERDLERAAVARAQEAFRELARQPQPRKLLSPPDHLLDISDPWAK